MVDTLPVSPQPPSPQPTAPVSPLPSAAPPTPPQQTSPYMPVPKGSDLAERSDPLTMQYAGFGARFLAAIVDGFISGTAGVILMSPLLIIAVVSGRPESVGEPSMLGLLFQLLGWTAMIGYYVYFTAKGQTLGKKALKIKVVRVESGEVPGYTKAFLREVVGKIVLALLFVGYLGFLWMLWDGKKQTWHDKIAGTVVVKA